MVIKSKDGSCEVDILENDVIFKLCIYDSFGSDSFYEMFVDKFMIFVIVMLILEFLIGKGKDESIGDRKFVLLVMFVNILDCKLSNFFNEFL